MKPSVPPLPSEHFSCHECGFSYDQPVDEALARLMAEVEQLVKLVGSSAANLHRHPGPTTWSAVEYLCHVRDVLAVTALRLHRVVHEQAPLLDPMFNDWRAVRFRYNDEDAPHVLGEIRRASQGPADEVASVPAGLWARTGDRTPDERRPAAWFVQHASHEMRHHLGVMRRLCIV